MKYYFIIDRNRVLHLTQAANKEAAQYKWDGDNSVKADIVVEAEIQPGCIYFMRPNLPDWLEYSVAKGLKLAPAKKAVYLQNEYGETELHNVPAGRDYSQIYAGRKNF